MFRQWEPTIRRTKIKIIIVVVYHIKVVTHCHLRSMIIVFIIIGYFKPNIISFATYLKHLQLYQPKFRSETDHSLITHS